MHLLIVKHGALGDVVRTSYFASPLRRKWGAQLRLSWITAPSSLPLLQFHPAIDDLWTSFDEARPHSFDCIFSLDDESEALLGVSGLDSRRLVGARFNGQGKPATAMMLLSGLIWACCPDTASHARMS